MDQVLRRADIEILQQSGQSHEADVLDQPVAHTSPFARAERNEIFRFDNFPLADKTGWIESQSLVSPIIWTNVQLVIVQKDHRSFLDIVT